jgi:hypothetical protein
MADCLLLVTPIPEIVARDPRTGGAKGADSRDGGRVRSCGNRAWRVAPVAGARPWNPDICPTRGAPCSVSSRPHAALCPTNTQYTEPDVGGQARTVANALADLTWFSKTTADGDERGKHFSHAGNRGSKPLRGANLIKRLSVPAWSVSTIPAGDPVMTFRGFRAEQCPSLGAKRTFPIAPLASTGRENPQTTIVCPAWNNRNRLMAFSLIPT